MRHRPTEPQLMLIVILFTVFAFAMQAHGEGGLGNGIRPEEKYQVEEVDSSMVGKYYRIHGVEIPAIWRSLDKEPLEDLAYALNRAHEERTCGKKRKCYGFVMGANGLESPCSEDNAR